MWIFFDDEGKKTREGEMVDGKEERQRDAQRKRQRVDRQTGGYWRSQFSKVSSAKEEK